MTDLVSVVIPTRNRPQLVDRAIRSVLSQTFQYFEILIVIDGPDDTTEPTSLKRIDPRVHVLSLPENVGLAEARNEGIRHAKGRWIALLDDDDEWLPEKLRFQVEKALELGGKYVFVPCKFIERTSSLERIMPKRLPLTPVNFSEYIYCNQGYLQPSMYFMSRTLCIDVPFTKGLRHVEDSDWLLRAMLQPGIQVGAVEQALSIYYNHKVGVRESETTPWQLPLRWAIDHHDLLSPRAFPFFIARLCLNARRNGESFAVFIRLLRTALQYGSLTPKSLMFFLAYWFVPDGMLKRMSTGLQRWLFHTRSVVPPQSRPAHPRANPSAPHLHAGVTK